MRLINADYLNEKFEDFYEKEIKHMPEEYAAFYCKLSTLLLQCPTAYDIDKVIVELSKDIEPNIDADTGELLDDWVVDMQNDLTAKHIRIVVSELRQN